MVFVFGLQTLWLLDFTKIYQLKGLKPKNNGQTNFYECCDLTKKVYLQNIQNDFALPASDQQRFIVQSDQSFF